MRRPRISSAAALTVGVTAVLGVVLVSPVHASADAVRDAQWYLAPLGVEQAWQTTRGAGVTVCVVDSGIDAQVPDLAGAVVGARTFARYTDADGLVSPHGTGVAAVLAGRGHDGSNGVIGVAPQARLLSAVVDEYDRPDIGRQASAAIRWCADQGAGVINLSIAEKTDGGMSAAVAYARSKDVVVVAASGNTFEPVTTDVLPYPAVIPGVVAVTGIDKDLRHDAGAMTSTRGKPVDLSAPFSTTDGSNGNPEVGLPAALGRHAPADARYALRAAGTSYSSPIVAGAAALVRAAHPSYSATQVVRDLLDTARPAGAPGVDRTYGHGIVDVAAAVAGIPETRSPSPSPSARATSPGSPSAAGPVERSRSAIASGAAASDSDDRTALTLAVGAVALAAAVGIALVVRRRARDARR